MIPGLVSFETSSIKDIEKYSTLSPITRSKNGTEKNNQYDKIENLTIELIALKLFVQEQLYFNDKKKRINRSRINKTASYFIFTVGNRVS